MNRAQEVLRIALIDAQANLQHIEENIEAYKADIARNFEVQLDVIKEIQQLKEAMKQFDSN